MVLVHVPGKTNTMKRITKAQRVEQLRLRLEKYGIINGSDVRQLKSIERALHNWREKLCGTEAGHVEQDERTGKWWFVSSRQIVRAGLTYSVKWEVRDMETGARKRLAALMAKYPTLVAYHQPDPRGCALYVLRKSDIAPDERIDSIYYRGIAVCV